MVNSVYQKSEKISRKLNIEKDYEKVRKETLEPFKFLLDIAAATIVGKRIIVPFVATPLANIVKEKMEAKNKAETEDTDSR